MGYIEILDIFIPPDFLQPNISWQIDTDARSKTILISATVATSQCVITVTIIVVFLALVDNALKN